MGFLSILLLVIFLLASLLLVALVLLQDEQGEGLGGIFGGGSSSSLGPRSGNILTRFTSILGAIFLFCALALAWLNRTPESGDVLRAARQGAAEERSVEEWWVVDDEETTPPEPEATAEETPTIEAGGDTETDAPE